MTESERAPQFPPIDYMRVAGGPLLISTLLASAAGRLSDAAQAVYGSAYVYAIGGVTMIGLVITTAVMFTLLLTTGYRRGGSYQDGIGAWSLRASYLCARATLAAAVLMAVSVLVANAMRLLA